MTQQRWQRFLPERSQWLLLLVVLAVIFALLALGQVFGFFGVLLALPLSAILLVGLRHGKASYLSSSMYRKP